MKRTITYSSCREVNSFTTAAAANTKTIESKQSNNQQKQKTNDRGKKQRKHILNDVPDRSSGNRFVNFYFRFMSRFPNQK